MPTLTEYSREGYDPEYLALEDAVGGRWHVSGDIADDAQAFDAQMTALAGLWPESDKPLEIIDDTIKGPTYTMNVRVYMPKSSELLPLMVYYFGGGFIAGNLTTDGPIAKHFAREVPCVVVTPQYPLSPKNTVADILVAGVEAAQWAQTNASRFGADPTRTILGGGSEGARLASMVAYHFTTVLKDSAAIFGCVFLELDAGTSTYDGPHKDKWHSWPEGMNADYMLFNGVQQKMVTDKAWGVDAKRPEYSILFANDLSRFPPCYMLAAEKDILRDDSVILDARLKDAGIRSKLKIYPGVPHWFHAFPQLKSAHKALAETAEGVQWLLSGQS